MALGTQRTLRGKASCFLLISIVLNCTQARSGRPGPKVPNLQRPIPCSYRRSCKVRGLTPWKLRESLRCPLHQWGSPSQALWRRGQGLERAHRYLLESHGISRVTVLPDGTGVLFSCVAVLRCLSGLLWDLKL